MVWTGDGTDRLAPTLLTLFDQLAQAYPAGAWQTSPQTGTIGDAAHRSEGSASDHNAWLDHTVRALDVAAGTPGGPDAEAIFAMVNRMYAAHDPRVWPDGYAIYLYRITDWNNPGGFHAQQGDPHLYHVHVSASTNPAGFNSTAPWPLAGAPTGDDMSAAEVQQILDGITGIRDAIAAHDTLHTNWEASLLKPLAAGTAAVQKALTDPTGVLARVASLQAQVQTLSANVGHQSTGGIGTGGTVDLAPVQTELSKISAQLSALSTHLGGTA